MKFIKINLPKEVTKLDIHFFADEHIGDAQSDIKRVIERVKKVAEDPNSYCILNGDIIDYASKTSIGDIETRIFNIQAQIEKAVEIFEPIKDKILAVTKGNHENRAYNREGIDISKLICAQLGILDRYTPGAAYLLLCYGHNPHQGKKSKSQTTCSFYINHGCGGGRKEGAKMIRLADMASIVDADVYVHSHTHLPAVMRNTFYRVNLNGTISNIEHLFINTASNLEYGGYGEVQEYKPNSMKNPIIHLSVEEGPKVTF